MVSAARKRDIAPFSVVCQCRNDEEGNNIAKRCSVAFPVLESPPTMAGNAAGIAKAREAQRLKREARAAQEEEIEAAGASASNTPNTDQPIPVAALLPVGVGVAASSEAIASKSQHFAVLGVDAAAPEAVSVLVQTMRQRKSPSLRFAAACKVLDLSIGKDRDKDPASVDDVLETVARALTLRQRAGSAVDAVQIREKDVTPTSSVHSQKPAD
jgi:hypothetical protein